MSDFSPELSLLPQIIGCQKDKDSLYVIIDYLSLIKGKDIKGENDEKYKDVSEMVRRTILQFPEVDFLFDQSGVPDNWISGIEFLLGEERTGSKASKVVPGFHIFNKNDGFIFSKLDYDNIFDGSNIRWAVRKKYYEDLELENKEGNFDYLQKQRCENLAVVIDDEPRQSRFNGFALYAAGYRVMPVHTARMLLALNDCIEKDMLNICIEKGKMKPAPMVIIRDFDLQFPDARKKKDYDEGTSTFKDVILWKEDWTITKDSVPVDSSAFKGEKKDGREIASQMIDSIRGYRFFSDDEDAKVRWKLSDKDKGGEFWGKKMLETPTYVITNGHDLMRVKHTKYQGWNIKGEWLEIQGIEKPVSGLYHPFFTRLKDKEGKLIIKENFIGTRYKISDGKRYGINKKRKNHNHGVPVDIYDTVSEMQHRAEEYYKDGRYIKAAVIAQEAIELLNGFHYQMMIKAYQLKTKAENAIAMDVVGADERHLVLDAVERIKIIKEDVRRIVYPLNKGERHMFFTDLIIQIHRRKKEHEILGHIFSDCRATCRDNEYFEVEAVFIREMARLDQRDIGVEDVNRYFNHRIFMKELTKNR